MFCFSGERQPGDDHVAVGGLRGDQPVGAGGQHAVLRRAPRGELKEDLVVVVGERLAGAVLREEPGAADRVVIDPGVQGADACFKGVRAAACSGQKSRARAEACASWLSSCLVRKKSIEA